MHSDLIPASRLGGSSLRAAGEASLVTNTQVQNATVITGIQANITATPSHADLQPLKARCNAGIDLGVAAGEYATAVVQAATGYDNLADTTESDTDKIGLIE